MFKFNYEEFKAAMAKNEEVGYKALRDDIEIVKAKIEKYLTMFLESSSNKARLSYPGADI